MSLQVRIRKKLGTFELNVSLETSQGILGLLGASGCGKSMTLKCIAGIETPDEGEIVLNGRILFDSKQKINLPPQERRVGYLFQNYALFPNMTLMQNVLCGLCREKGRKHQKELAQEMIDRMELTGLEKRKPPQLSGGQQQRAAIARILVSRPEILLLDEPFSALDDFLSRQLQTKMVRWLKDFGREVILVSHNRDELYRMCDHLALMAQGEILGCGGRKEMFEKPGTMEGAILTGCMNNVLAGKTGEYEVEVPSWGVRFTTKEPVRDSLYAIGVREPYFDETEIRNQADIEVLEEIEEPFSLLQKFRYADAAAEAEPVLRRISKEKRAQGSPERVGIAPENIMLFYR